MAPKLFPWEADVQKAIDYLAKSRVFTFDQFARLIDYLAVHKVVPRQDLLNQAVRIKGGDGVDFVKTTLARVTTPVHGKGNVPDPGGWYFHDDKMDVYVMDRGFSAAWRNARQ
jgi:hypothetical protein